jgi:hypothetical protein
MRRRADNPDVRERNVRERSRGNAAMNVRVLLSACAMTIALAACAGAHALRVTDASLPRALPGAGPVDVHWIDPAQFTELRYSFNRHEAARGDWVVQLAEYIRDRAAQQLPPGERLDVEILDIERAGEYEYFFGPATDIRVMRDIYPPRMRLHVRRTGADGRVIEEGERRISDIAYLTGPQPLSNTDPLRYEKRMIDRWVRRELATR